MDTGIAPNKARLRNIVAVAAGRAHGLALRRDGHVVGWGDNYYRQAMPPEGLDQVVAIAAGEFHSLALRANGTVVAWGNNFQGQVNIPQDLNDVMAISAGQSHSLALRTNGTVVAWGHDFYGQISVPEDLNEVTAIAAGNYHSLALKRDGSVVGWGSNLFGQTSVPVWLSDAVAVAASSSHSAAIRKNREVALWGSNYYQQSIAPKELNNVADITLGAARTVVIQGKLQPPVILSPLPSGLVSAGRNVTLVPFLTGSQPMIYQWIRNGRPIEGAATKALTLQAVDAETSASYSVIVANPAGNTRSPNASIEVEDPQVRIRVNPEVAILGNPAVFTAEASGTLPLSFRWMKNGEALDVPEGDTLLIQQVQDTDTGVYSLEVNNEFGTAKSNEIVFYIAPQILEKSTARVAARIGENVTLSISAKGSSPLSFQWRRDGEDLEDETQATLTLENIRPDDDGVFSVRVSNPVGQVISDSMQIQIVPHIVLQPEPQIFSGFGGSAVFEVRAIGTEPMSYRWMKDGKQIAETKLPRLVLEHLQAGAGGQYQVIVVNSAGQTESDPVSLVVPPAIETHPRSHTVRAADSVEFTVQAEGSPPIYYQWLKDGEPLVGADESTLHISEVRGENTGRYSAVAMNDAGQVTSQAAMLTVSPTILDAPDSATAATGETVTLEVVAEGSGQLHFKWVKNGAAIGAAMDPVLILRNVGAEDAGNYSVVVSNAVGIAVSEDAIVEITSGDQ